VTFNCGGIVVRPVKTFVGVAGEITEENTENVSYVQARPFDDNTLVFSILAETEEATDAVLSPGQNCSTDLSDPALRSVQVGSTFVGGTLPETTNELLERAATSINAKVVTGRDNIRSFLDSQTEVNVVDAAAFGMGDDEMLRDQSNSVGISTGGSVDIYVATGPVPSTASADLTGTRDSDGVWTVVIPSDTFPGAYGVLDLRYQGNIINADLNHVLGLDVNGTTPRMTTPLHARYSAFQTLEIEFRADDIAESITEATFTANVFYMPGVGALQDFVDGEDVRSYAYDQVIKGAIPVLIGANLEVEYRQGIEAPDVSVIQTAICNVINAKRMGTEVFYASEVVYAVKLVFPDGEVKMPINLFGRVFLPDGTQAYATDNNHIRVGTDVTGLSERNSSFFCLPSNIEVTLTEVLG
jgi:hypothetical protein